MMSRKLYGYIARGQPQYEASFIDLPAEKKQILFGEEGILVYSPPWLYMEKKAEF